MSSAPIVVASLSILVAGRALPAAPQAPTQPPAQPPAASEPAKPAAASARVTVEPADIKWLDRVPKDDRAALDELLGWAPPPFDFDLEWVGSGATTWDNLRGKVVVLQSFTTGSTAGRGWPARIAKALEGLDAKDVRIIALHTPEDSALAAEFLAKKPAPEGVAVVIDRKGAFCDSLAIYKHPMNIVVDRNGAVRYAGLNLNGLEQAVTGLVAEPFKQDLVVGQRSADEVADAPAASGDFPPITGAVESAIDIRGKRAPEFFVAQWLNTDPPDAKNKVVVVDFWATWCGPCVASIPHMNELAGEFGSDVVCVGISDEKKQDFDSGMTKLKSKGITLTSFEYAVALDPGHKMYGPLNIRGIPHCIVMDRNWIVRWQGHPASLNAATLGQIVKADKALAGGGSGGGSRSTPKPGSAKRKRWTP